MPESPSASIVSCPGCGRRVNADKQACYFCGRALTGTERAAPAQELTTDAALPARRSSSGQPLCPLCGADRPLLPLKVEAWTYEGVTFKMENKYQVRSIEVPLHCEVCRRQLMRQRWLAVLLLGAPLWILSGLAITVKFAAVLAVFYFLYAVGKLSYSWADRAIYGEVLEGKLYSHIKLILSKEAKVQFPVSLLGWFGRGFLLLTGGFLALIVGECLAQLFR